MIKETKGDLIELAKQGEFNLIAHGANCFKTMGAGIALQIRNNFPDAYKADKSDARLSLERLGDFTSSSHYNNKGKNFTIINLYTQFEPGPNLDYEALTLGLRKVNMLYGGLSIGLPQIGAGIGSGDWNKILKIIKRELKDMDVTIVYYEKS